MSGSGIVGGRPRGRLGPGNRAAASGCWLERLLDSGVLPGGCVWRLSTTGCAESGKAGFTPMAAHATF